MNFGGRGRLPPPLLWLPLEAASIYIKAKKTVPNYYTRKFYRVWLFIFFTFYANFLKRNTWGVWEKEPFLFFILKFDHFSQKNKGNENFFKITRITTSKNWNLNKKWKSDKKIINNVLKFLAEIYHLNIVHNRFGNPHYKN